MEMSLENFYVDTGAKRNRLTPRRQQEENSPRKGIKLTAKTVDEDPASYKRWISRKEIYISQDIKNQKREVQRLLRSCSEQRVLFFSAGHTSHLQVYICKPEEGWYGQPKHCYDKTRSHQLRIGLWISRFWPQKGLSLSYNFLDF